MQTVCFREDTYVLTIEELDLSTAQRVSALLRTIRARRFIVNLSSVGLVEAAGVAELVQSAEGRPVGIVTDDPRVERAFGLAARGLAVHARLADALAA